MELEILLQKSSEYTKMEERNCPLSHVYFYGEQVSERVSWLPGGDLRKLIEANGGTIHGIDYAGFRKYSSVVENSIYVHEDRTFDVILPEYADAFENGFTLVHELGHYVLHSGAGMCYACRNGETPVEKEADCFALGFLMPAKTFKAANEKYRSISDLALFFAVPEFAVKARLASLGLKAMDKVPAE